MYDSISQIAGLFATFVCPVISIFLIAIYFAQRHISSVDKDLAKSFAPSERLPNMGETLTPWMREDEVLSGKVNLKADDVEVLPKPGQQLMIPNKPPTQQEKSLLEQLLEEKLAHVNFSIKLKLQPGKELSILGQDFKTTKGELEISTKPSGKVEEQKLSPEDEIQVNRILTEGETPEYIISEAKTNDETPPEEVGMFPPSPEDDEKLTKKKKIRGK